MTMKLLAKLSAPPKAPEDFDQTETLLILPFFLYLFLALRLRRLLRRRLGRRAGTVLGNCVIVVLGYPPCLFGFVTLLLLRLSLNLLDMLDKWMRRRSSEGRVPTEGLRWRG
jgi:hypothetical protein